MQRAIGGGFIGFLCVAKPQSGVLWSNMPFPVNKELRVLVTEVLSRRDPIRTLTAHW